MDHAKPPPSFQELILQLHGFWSRQGCVILQPYDMEMGAGTFHPATHAPRPRPGPVAGRLCPALPPPYRRPLWRKSQPLAALLPVSGHHEAQPGRRQELLLEQPNEIGLDPLLHDFRFVEDDWESPTLGRLGPWLGGLVRRHGGRPVHLFPAGRRLSPSSRRLRIDLRPGAARDVRPGRGERLRSRLQRTRLTYGDVFLRAEREFSAYNFEDADTAMLFERISPTPSRMRGAAWPSEPALPAYDQCIKASHLFNLLDARGVISVAERASLYRPGARARQRAPAKAWLPAKIAPPDPQPCPTDARPEGLIMLGTFHRATHEEIPARMQAQRGGRSRAPYRGAARDRGCRRRRRNLRRRRRRDRAAAEVGARVRAASEDRARPARPPPPEQALAGFPAQARRDPRPAPGEGDTGCWTRPAPRRRARADRRRHAAAAARLSLAQIHALGRAEPFHLGPPAAPHRLPAGWRVVPLRPAARARTTRTASAPATSPRATASIAPGASRSLAAPIGGEAARTPRDPRCRRARERDHRRRHRRARRRRRAERGR